MNRYFGLHTLEGEWHALLPRYILLAERLKGRRVLDIGCGSGIGASMLRELGAEMVDAIDHRPAVLEVARMKHMKDGLDFHVMFWEELDFPDDTFDVVVCLDPSSPVTDPSLIQEVRRVLKEGGEYICAIERKTLAGLETLLPRYGYTDSAESVDINDAQERVPQLGELEKHFETVRSIVQRPLLAYVFDLESEGETTRKQGEDGGVWTEGEGPDGDDSGRWLSIENGLSSKETDPGSVEIWFCGDSELPAPPLKEVRLPYYGITERLEQVVGDLQVRGVNNQLGDDDSLFDEVLDEPDNENLDDRYDVSTFEQDQWESQPTTIHQPVPPKQAPRDVSQFQNELAELKNLYSRMHGDFQSMMSQAQNALAERDGYIQHLVQQVQMWQSRYAGQPADESTTTGVFKKLDTHRGNNDGRKELEAEVARLRDEQRRLAAELEEKNAFLRANDDKEDTSEHEAAKPEAGLDESSVSEVGEESSVSEVGEESSVSEAEEEAPEETEEDSEDTASDQEEE